jgi:hypothetical protein
MSEISLFDSHGEFVMPSDAAIAALDAGKRERFNILKAAVLDKEASEAGLAAAMEHVTACVKALRLAREAQNLARPKRTFMDEWRASRDQGA